LAELLCKAAAKVLASVTLVASVWPVSGLKTLQFLLQPGQTGSPWLGVQHRRGRSLKTWVHPDRLMINQWPQQGGDLRVCMILELITGEFSCDTSDEIGDLDPRFAAGIDESDIGQLAARLVRGVGSCDVGETFWCQCGLLIVYH
jgi:hypothetical protein